MDYKGVFPSRRSIIIVLALFCAVFTGINVRHVGASRYNALSGGTVNEAGSDVSAKANTASMPQEPGHSSIVVKVNPRLDHGTGDATILLFDKQGTLLKVLHGVVSQFQGLAIGINGPRRTVKNGDTPFGVYKFDGTQGGEDTIHLKESFGTGKVNVNDHDMYGEVADAGRSLIRLHGGGTGLKDPYNPDQKLKPTNGCVRMKNRDVNILIQAIKQRPQNDTLKYIFMGDDKYLNRLATDTALRDKPWQRVLRIDLGLDQPEPFASTHAPLAQVHTAMPALQQPVEAPERTPPIARPERTPSIERPEISSPDISPDIRPEVISPDTRREGGAPQTASQERARLIERVELFSEDVGEKGGTALAELNSSYPDRENLVHALSNLRESLPPDDGRRPQIAFVLCSLGQDCAANKQVIQSVLDGTAQYQGFYADQAEEMISRLIDKGDDKELLQTLFNASTRADGALSEGLAETFVQKLRDRTIFFLSVLKDQPKIIISKVAELIRTTEYLTRQEIKNLKAHIDSAQDSSRELKQALKKLLTSLLRGKHEDADERPPTP